MRDDTIWLVISRSLFMKLIAPDGRDEAKVEFETLRTLMKDIIILRF